MAAITVADLTSGGVDGTGVFDQLMRATKAHLDEEYSKSRIKGSEYATVYLGAMQSAMNQSLQFLLQEQRSDLEAQLLQEQVLEMAARTRLLDEQTANALTENTTMVKQQAKLDAEVLLIQQQELKSASEVALLDQKKKTEEAQVNGVGIAEDSILGKQRLLYQNQADGYIRDSEQRIGKMFFDTWNVRRSTDATTAPVDANNHLRDEDIGAIAEKLAAGINVTFPA